MNERGEWARRDVGGSERTPDKEGGMTRRSPGGTQGSFHLVAVVLTLVGLAALAGCSGNAADEATALDGTLPTRITVVELQERMDDGDEFVFIDARSSQSWRSSTKKLPGSIRVPAGMAEEHLEEIPPGSVLVAYCT
jgi:hypothetical protein